MELNGMYSITFHHLHSFCLSSDLGGIRWNTQLINFANYSLRFKISVTLAKKNCFKMNVTLHFQYNFNFFLPTLLSPTFLSHNFQCNFKFVFFL